MRRLNMSVLVLESTDLEVVTAGQHRHDRISVMREGGELHLDVLKSRRSERRKTGAQIRIEGKNLLHF